MGTALKKFFKEWSLTTKYGKAAIVVMGLLMAMLGGAIIAMVNGILSEKVAWVLNSVFTSIVVFSFLVVLFDIYKLRHDGYKRRIFELQKNVQDNPGDLVCGWELASGRIEMYLDRNISQVQYIFWLTIAAVAVGFLIVVYGLYKTFENPENLSVSVVGVISGIVLSFIGGSFLQVYKSIAVQSQQYISVLERMNAVGMAFNVLNIISEDGVDIKNEAAATLGREVLALYSKCPTNHGDHT